MQYDNTDPLSIFRYSGRLLNHTLAEVAPLIDNSVTRDVLDQKGKGGLGVLVEKYFFGYEPNSSPEPDFAEAGLELKVSPLKKNNNGQLAIKERLVCDMIDYCAVVNEDFENSRFFKKTMLMLIMFYLHISGYSKCDLQFIYSVLWKIKEKDLLIIRDDFCVIRDKIRKGLAHELSEGDTLYLGACRKGQKGQPPRKQPNSPQLASARAFSLKPAYMRTILDFAVKSGKNLISNLTTDEMPGIELATVDDLKKDTFENILIKRFIPFIGQDYRQIAKSLGLKINPSQKNRYAYISKQIVQKGMTNEDSIEELRKAGIKIKAIRIQKNGKIKEHLSFERIDYQEVFDTEDWLDSKWYEIITTRYMFVVYREVDDDAWTDEPRYVLDKMFFWTMPTSDFTQAERFWENIRANVMNDTLQDFGDKANTFWTLKDHKYFHVRPKARNAEDVTFSPVSQTPVPKKAYWFDNRYILKEVKNAYDKDWALIFKNEE